MSEEYKDEPDNLEDISLEAIAASAPGIIILVDPQYKIRYINRVSTRYQMDQVVGASIFDFLEKSERKRQQEAVDLVFETGGSVTLENYVRGVDGSEDGRWYSTRFGPITQGPSKGKYAILFTSDIHEQKITQQSLASSEEKFRLITENSPDFIMMINKELTIEYINHVVPGLKKEEVIGSHLSNYLDPDYKKMVEGKIETLFSKAVPVKYETKGVGPNGESRWYSSRISPIILEGVVKSAILMTVDVTDRKQVEIQAENFNKKLEETVTQRTKELEKANVEIKTLLKEMHHRVKNNLQIISSLLNIQANSSEDKELQSILRVSQDRIGSMSMLHENLYKREKLSEINIEEYLNALVMNRVETYNIYNKVNSKVIVDVKDTDFDVDVMIPLGLLMNELITNSFKHAFPNGSEGEIRLKITEPESESYRLTYQDNGVGISDEVLNDNNKTTIGRDLIQCFVDQMNGEMITSSSDKGVKYEIRF